MESTVIILNGREHPIEGIATVSELLASLRMDNKPVVVELDGKALLPREFDSSALTNGSRVEIVSIVAGG